MRTCNCISKLLPCQDAASWLQVFHCHLFSWGWHSDERFNTSQAAHIQSQWDIGSSSALENNSNGYTSCVTANPILMKLIRSYSCTLTFPTVTGGFGHAKTARLVSLVPLSRRKIKYILLLQSNNQCCKNVCWGQLFELFLEAETAPLCYFIVMNVKCKSSILVRKKYFTERSTGDLFLTDTRNNVK